MMSLLSFQALNVVVHLLSIHGQKVNQSFIKNILICHPKMTGGLTGWEQHEGE